MVPALRTWKQRYSPTRIRTHGPPPVSRHCLFTKSLLRMCCADYCRSVKIMPSVRPRNEPWTWPPTCVGDRIARGIAACCIQTGFASPVNGRSRSSTPYSGYFSVGSRGLIVGRYSTCCSETRRGFSRSLSLVGKLYPTMDPNHREPLRPAQFITQQDIGGVYTDFINDVELCNAPNTTAWRRGSGIGVLLVTGAVFRYVDNKPSIRQLYQIAELGKAESEPTRAPTFMRLLVAPEQPRIEGRDLDFREEIMAQIYDRGEATPKRVLTFHIEVTDEGETQGPAFFERRTFRGWRHIGKIAFQKAVASYNADFVIHFNHPTWRHNQNEPSTATRIRGRKVR